MNPRAGLLVYVHSFMDIDLLLPLLKRARDHGQLKPRAWLSEHVTYQAPWLGPALSKAGVEFEFPGREQVIAERPFAEEVRALVTSAESTAKAHRDAHLLTKRANEAGIRTYTLQHGFENIGLTYSDWIHSLERVRFASQTVFTWCGTERLHKDVPDETRRKCVPVGCSKEVIPGSPELRGRFSRQSLVAVFENLHWRRYDEKYAQRFLADFEQTARSFPDVAFVIKPHPGGRWITHLHTGSRPSGDNVMIADITDPSWSTCTGPALVAIADGVITTPSTVALDAARAGRPVAMVGYDLELEYFDPLPVFRTTDDWASFAGGLRSPESCLQFTAKSRSFLERNVRAGDSCAEILRIIAEDVSRHRR